jgi:hypothetical protein
MLPYRRASATPPGGATSDPARLSNPRRRPVLAAGFATAVLLVEHASVPLDLRKALPVPAALQALAMLPSGALAEFPYFYLEHDLYRTSQYMLYSTAHWHPLVNGYSDFIPDD